MTTSNNHEVTIKVKRDGGTAAISLPSYATPGAAGMDLRASESAILDPGMRRAIGTGICLQIPEGYEGQVRPRSGLAMKHGVTLLNAPGTIDSDYRGEVRVILINHGDEPFHVEPGDRIAQIVFAPVQQVRLLECEALNETERSGGGFGSTGLG